MLQVVQIEIVDTVALLVHLEVGEIAHLALVVVEMTFGALMDVDIAFACVDFDVGNDADYIVDLMNMVVDVLVETVHLVVFENWVCFVLHQYCQPTKMSALSMKLETSSFNIARTFVE